MLLYDECAWFDIASDTICNLQPYAILGTWIYTSYDDCVDAHMPCMCVFMNCIWWMQHVNVLPVLKHGPRSLMCVQVRNRDY